MIDALKYIEKHNEKIDDDTLQYITSNKVAVKDLPMKRTGMTLQRMVNYLRKQSSMEKMSFAGTNNLYKDYLKMAADRGMDLTDEIVCHTTKLRKMHDRYLEEKNAKEAEAERTRVNRMFPGSREHFWRILSILHIQKAALRFLPRKRLLISSEREDSSITV